MQRLVPAILEAWREAERAMDSSDGQADGDGLADRIHVLRSAHAMATAPGADRELVARFLREHGAGDVLAAAEGASLQIAARIVPPNDPGCITLASRRRAADT